ncbi:DgyrCDS11845 [Dimorphilus gyrociliatus]|nr:DgyrCDS11845 [Dimorphilus gyrociliatus]
MNIYTRRKEQHESFMKSRSEDVLGRDDIIKEMEAYLYDSSANVPYLVLGNAGSGKSSILAKLAHNALERITAGDIKPFKNREWRMFCHFVGAVPGSTAVDDMILRLYKEITGKEIKENERSNAVQVVSSLLANDNINPTIIIIDALNQFDNDDDGAKYVTWLPKKLSSGIRIILSMINGTQQAEVLEGREPKPRTLIVSELNSETRTEIVTTLLGKYNKRLDEDQMEVLLSKKSSHNPLWLSIACEELRVFGKFREISNKIDILEDGLLELEVQVLSRFEEENGGNLMIATLCLIEVSGMGLLETELLTLLGHEEILNLSNEKEEMECSEKPINHNKKLPAFKWAEVFRALKPFIRPFGDSGEGRLDFYHRSFSKAVRKRYLEKADGTENTGIKKFWHSLLANFFLSSKNFDRKLEELPIHLVALKRKQDLCGFLSDWDVINKLYDTIFSKKLVDYWRQGCSLTDMIETYTNMAENILNKGKKTKNDHLEASIYLEKLSSLLTQGGEYKFSVELCSKAISEAQEGKAEDIRMANLYYLTGYILDEKLKLDNYIERSHTAIIKNILENFEKAIEIWRLNKDKEIRHKLARTLDRSAFHYTGLQESLDGQQFREKSIECNKEAIAIFRELGDRLMEGDCLTTRSLACVRGDPEQAKFYDLALEMLTQNGGDMNLQIHRLYLNYGIYYEDIRSYEKAYDMFRKWYDLGIELFGFTHPKVKRAIETLNEPIYHRIARIRKDPIPNAYEKVEGEKT